MARVLLHRLQFTVIWVTRMELAWQSSVTTAKVEHMWRDMRARAVTHEIFITPERVFLSWRVSPESRHTANSLSVMSAVIHSSSEVVLDGGCHGIRSKWITGEERHPAVVRAHAGWPAHVHTLLICVIVTRKTAYCVRTAVSLLTRHIFRLNSWGLVIQAMLTRKDIIRSENLSVMAYSNITLKWSHLDRYHVQDTIRAFISS